MMHKATLYDSGNEVAGKGTGKFVRSKIKLLTFSLI